MTINRLMAGYRKLAAKFRRSSGTRLTVNEDLIRRTLEFIRDNPDQWSQETWGASGWYQVRCFGAWAYYLGTGRHIEEAPGSLYFATSRISELLGISEAQGRRLFYDLSEDFETFADLVAEETGVRVKVPT